MALIETGMYGNAQAPDYLGNFMRGMQARQQFEQRKAEQRKQRQDQQEAQKFEQTFRGLVQVNDINTPEGRTGLVRDLNRLGYGKQAIGLMGQFHEMDPRPAQKTYQSVETDQGFVPFDAQTGTYGAPAKANGRPLMKPATPAKPAEDKWAGTTWVTSGGKKVAVDAEGRDKNGRPVILDKEHVKPDGPKSTDIFSQEQQLRTQYLGQTKEFRDVRDAYSRIQISTKDPSPAGDLSLIYNFMKMQDPGSTVRESEFAAAAASGSYGDRLQAAGAKLLNGERLSPAQRADFIGQSKKLYGTAEFQKKKTQSEYRKMASQYPGLNPDRVLFEDDIATGPAPAASAKLPTHDQYDSLPSGAEFTDPDGNVRRKP